jgi:8-oxo-dGTP diphosphatase
LSNQPYKYCPMCGSRLSSRLQYGKQRETCPACGFIHFTDPKVAAGVLVEKDGQVLLVRRVMQPHQGEWSFPAGFMDAFEDPEQAAIRECLEETGLIARTTGLLTVVGGREHPNGADVVIIYRAEITGGQLCAGDDADQVGFFAYDRLPPLAFRATRVALGVEDQSE